MNNIYWIKITKWNTSKPHFCSIKADSQNHTLYAFEDQLLRKGNLNCHYFSTNGRYPRGINDIMNFEFVDESEVVKFINRINYAIEKQNQEELVA